MENVRIRALRPAPEEAGARGLAYPLPPRRASLLFERDANVKQVLALDRAHSPGFTLDTYVALLAAACRSHQPRVERSDHGSTFR